MTDFFETASTGPIQGDRFGSAAKDYADHRKGFPDTTFDELLKLGVGESGQSLLDLGCGTGTLARGFANRGCVVTGADICLLYTSPSPRDPKTSRMPSSA